MINFDLQNCHIHNTVYHWLCTSGPALLPVSLSECIDSEATLSGCSETEQPDDLKDSTCKVQRSGPGWRRVMGRHKRSGRKRENTSKARRLIAKVFGRKIVCVCGGGVAVL